MERASGSWIPVALTIDLEKNVVLDHDEPLGGDRYIDDIKAIFPWHVEIQLLYLKNIDEDQLEKENFQKAKIYYESRK